MDRFFPPPHLTIGSTWSSEELDPLIEKYFSWMNGQGSDQVHSGTAGIVLLCWCLHKLTARNDPEAQKWLLRMIEAGKSLGTTARPPRAVTFVEGQSGIWCMQGLIDPSKQRALQAQLCDLADAVSLDPEMPNELWYGRAGVLSSLLFAQQHFELKDDSIPKKALLLYEKIESEMDGWSWHGKRYLGLVHGWAGIILVLLRANRIFCWQKNTSALVAKAVQILQFQFDSGNIQSNPKNKKDVLVQLCHGAPGVAMLFLEIGMLDPAVLCCNCIWQRGLLTKGVGLCHGISGNALVFVQCFFATGNLLWLDRAVAFAKFAVSQCPSKDSSLVVSPDDPWGLVNGIGGLVYLLAVLKSILNSPSSDHEKCNLPFLFF